ncbi:MAG: hypothetical protein BIFFINMI_01578 [Phycisphaerae bacterium]|nr:hypothetical protein [Phycisphaerae bacterium]
MREAYQDRIDAGRALGLELDHYRGRSDVVVLGVPRGGVPVAMQVAGLLGAPLDVMLVRRLIVPDPEDEGTLVVGAVGIGGTVVRDENLIRQLGIPEQTVERICRQELAELQHWERAYRGRRPCPPLARRCAVLVTESLESGWAMRVAADALRGHQPAQIVVAAPVGQAQVVRDLADHVDEVICPVRPEPYRGASAWFRNFRRVDDDEVRALLQSAWGGTPGSGPAEE